jgi:hypothetical protein
VVLTHPGDLPSVGNGSCQLDAAQQPASAGKIVDVIDGQGVGCIPTTRTIVIGSGIVGVSLAEIGAGRAKALREFRIPRGIMIKVLKIQR